MSFQPRSPHQNLNSLQLREYMKQCQEPLDSIDPDTEEPYDWKGWGVLAFQYYVGPSRARQLFYRWLREIRKQEPHCFTWFAVFANDRWNKDIRIHFLLGGGSVTYQPLLGSSYSYQARWTARWQDLSGGDAAIHEYRRGAFVEHVLKKAKNAHAGQYFQITMDFGYGLFEV
jgi:hypothetical protein